LPVIHNAAPVSEAAKTDYAVCAGDKILHTRGGPASTNPRDFHRYRWNNYRAASGVAYVLSQISISQITDGTSHTALVGEKSLSWQHYDSGKSLGDDQAAYLGDDADIRRWTDEPPRRDTAADDIQHFGSAHSSGCHFVLCDGAVRFVAYSIDPTIFKNFGNRHDNNPIELPK